MRAFVQRPLAFAILGFAAVLSGRALAQSSSEASTVDAPGQSATNPAEEPEEITIRGRRSLTEYRVELERAREEIVEAYNEANSSDDNDVTCRNERPTGSRMPQRVCRSNAESEAEASAARWFLNSLTTNAGRFEGEPGVGAGGAAVPFAGGPQVDAAIGTAVAQGDEVAGSLVSRAKIEEELERLKKENRQVYRAVVKYIELEDEYNKARAEAAR